MLQSNPFNKAAYSGIPLILDGAMGSLLQQRGFNPDSKMWMSELNITNPDVIKNLHEEYICAGADIITTNTFRTNPAAFEGAGYKFDTKYALEGVKIAKEATRNLNIFIAGSNPPAEDCYQKVRKLNYNKLELNHNNHIELLADNGVDFILNETQSHFDEIKIICENCSSINIPYILSIYVVEDFKILSGESLNYVTDFILDHNPLAIGFNCISPSLFLRMLPLLNLNYIWGFYLNCGVGEPEETIIKSAITTQDYINVIKQVNSQNLAFVGTCCGSNPKFIKEIKKYYAKN